MTPERRQVAEYIHALSIELEPMAAGAGLDLAAYLLRLIVADTEAAAEQPPIIKAA
jgi:hypothetical protein